jgi:hypothetical protein
LPSSFMERTPQGLRWFSKLGRGPTTYPEVFEAASERL